MELFHFLEINSLVWPFLSVCANVFFQVTKRGKDFIAFGAIKRLAIMQADVCLKSVKENT